MTTSTTGIISSAGIGSGLDVNSIIDKLVAVESQPLTLLQNQATSLNDKLSSIGKLQSYFSTLRDKSNALVSPTLWSATSASASDASVLKVSTSTSATPASYSVAVNKLATSQTVSSTTFADSNATLGAGTLTIELGTWTGTPTSGFTTKTGSTPITVTIADGTSKLSDVRDQINAAGAGVVASIVTDASGSRLSLRSSATGAENAFRITASETVDDGNAATGLSVLSYDAAGGASQLTRSIASGNADLTINGIAVSSASNTLSNVLDGLSLTLTKTTSTPVTVDVVTDTAAVKTAITDFVTAFNAVASFIKTQTAYNADAKTGGVLQGDQGTLSIQNQLRAVINEASTASGTWTRLSDVGLALKSDGTLETSTTKLDNALGNLPELKKLFATDGADTASSGFIRRFKRLADAALATEGTFDSRTASLRTSVTSNTKAQDAMNLRISQVEARLRKQYTALDTVMAQYSTLSTFMTNQIAQYNKSG